MRCPALGPHTVRELALFVSHYVGVYSRCLDVSMSEPALNYVERNTCLRPTDPKSMPQRLWHRWPLNDSRRMHYRLYPIPCCRPTPMPYTSLVQFRVTPHTLNAMNFTYTGQKLGRYRNGAVHSALALFQALDNDCVRRSVDALRNERPSTLSTAEQPWSDGSKASLPENYSGDFLNCANNCGEGSSGVTATISPLYQHGV